MIVSRLLALLISSMDSGVGCTVSQGPMYFTISCLSYWSKYFWRIVAQSHPPPIMGHQAPLLLSQVRASNGARHLSAAHGTPRSGHTG